MFKKNISYDNHSKNHNDELVEECDEIETKYDEYNENLITNFDVDEDFNKNIFKKTAPKAQKC